MSRSRETVIAPSQTSLITARHSAPIIQLRAAPRHRNPPDSAAHSGCTMCGDHSQVTASARRLPRSVTDLIAGCSRLTPGRTAAHLRADVPVQALPLQPDDASSSRTGCSGSSLACKEQSYWALSRRPVSRACRVACSGAGPVIREGGAEGIRTGGLLRDRDLPGGTLLEGAAVEAA
jgi:hypothetical protein